MTLYIHEMRRGRVGLIIWTAVIAFMLGVTVFIYPQMASQMDEVSKTFADMGAFSSAFGMDRLNFGELGDYFCVECGNTLGLGGAMFAALLGTAALAKEEREHTAEFLFTHPISRVGAMLSKLAALASKIVLLNAGVAAVSALSIVAIGETVNVRTVALVLTANLILQLEIAAISFCVSAFVSRGTGAIGIGIAFAFYFVNIISNISEDLKFLKYITPYAYSDGAEIKTAGALDAKYLAVGGAIAAVCVAAAFVRYRRKDL